MSQKKNPRMIEFLEDFTEQASSSEPSRQKQQFQQDLRTLSDFLALCLCRVAFLVLLFLLAIATSIGRSHTPVSLYGLLCYFFVYLILSEYTKKYKTQGFSLPSLRLRYHYRYQKLLTEQLCFWFSFLLLAALQYAFLYTIQLDNPFLTYSPPAIALFLLLLRYLSPPVLRFFLKRQLIYQRRL